MSSRITTSLLLAHQALSVPALRDLVPAPVNLYSCGRLGWRECGDLLTAAWNIPPSRLTGLQEILPCFCGPRVRGYRFSLEYQLDGTDDIHTATLDPVGEIPAAASHGPAVSAEIDLLRVHAPLRSATVRLTARSSPPHGLHAPALAALSLRHFSQDTAAPAPTGPVSSAGGTRLIDVPVRSQMVLDPAISGRVCSPVCVGMLLEHYGRPVDIYQMIREAHHVPSGLYGVWPANIQAAARHGLLGFLLHFPGFRAVHALLDRGVPVIASIRFEPGELAGAPVRRSSGHLVLVCGHAGDRIIVNDPAAPDAAGVRREYARGDLERVWLGRSAVGYVLVPEQRLIPPEAAPADAGRRTPTEA